MTVRRFLEQEGDGLTFEHYYRHPRSYSRRGIFSVDEPAPTMRGTNRPMPPNYRRHEGDTTDPSAGEVRALSAAMRARIQTFPTAYRWIGPRTHVEQMIGNAVPVRLHVRRPVPHGLRSCRSRCCGGSHGVSRGSLKSSQRLHRKVRGVRAVLSLALEIGRASCRERVCQYV